MTDQRPFYPGDRWTVPVTVLASDGVTPEDITGWTLSGELYVAFQAAPIELTADNGGVIAVALTAGQFALTVAPEITADVQPQDSLAVGFPTALRVIVDPGGDPTTLGVVPMPVRSPRLP